jgi:hypothetical protein
VTEIKVQEEMEFALIPELPYTYKERMDDICRAKESYAMGKTITAEALKKRIATL